MKTIETARAAKILDKEFKACTWIDFIVNDHKGIGRSLKFKVYKDNITVKKSKRDYTIKIHGAKDFEINIMKEDGLEAYWMNEFKDFTLIDNDNDASYDIIFHYGKKREG